jgi:type I restriction enzyme S subunit
MSSWRECKLGDVAARMTSGGTPSTSKSEYYDGNIPWLNTKEIKNCRIFQTEKAITELGLQNSSAKWIDENSVIVAMYGATAGKVAINKIPLSTNQACCNITLNTTQADYNFIYYLLLNSFDRLDNMTSGAAQQNLNVGLISNFDIALPPLEEQKAIAEVLSSLDDKIDLLHRQNQTLESLAQTFFRQWFIEEAKEEWEVVTLSDLGKVVTGKTPSTSNEDFWGEDVLFITPTDFKNYNKYAFYSDRKLSTIGKDKVKNCVLPKNSILVTCIGSDMGKVVITKNECVTNQQINSLVLSNDNLLNEYVFQYLKSIYPLLRAIALGGTTMPIINKTDFENIEILLPTDEVLEKFQSITLSSNQKIIENTKQIQTLENLRDTLLPMLVSGEVRVEI